MPPSQRLPEVLDLAGLENPEYSERFILTRWQIPVAHALYAELRGLLVELDGIAARAARGAFEDVADDEEEFLAKAAAQGRTGTAVQWDYGGADEEQGRWNRRAHMRYALCQILEVRSASTEDPPTSRNAAALALISIAAGAQGELVRFLLGGGGLIPRLRAYGSNLDAGLMSIAYDLGPNGFRGEAGVIEYRRIALRVRAVSHALLGN